MLSFLVWLIRLPFVLVAVVLMIASGLVGVILSLLGVGLIPLGAAALGLGVTGASATAITVVGLTGAAGYAEGQWLDSTPRQRAYIAGYNAVNCALEAVAPLDLDDTTESRLTSGLAQIDSSATATETALAATQSARLSVPDRIKLAAFADEEIKAARQRFKHF